MLDVRVTAGATATRSRPTSAKPNLVASSPPFLVQIVVEATQGETAAVATYRLAVHICRVPKLGHPSS